MRTLAALFLFSVVLRADVTNCSCDPSNPASMTAGLCSLCREAEKHTGEMFFLKDTNPRKPNRTLLLPRAHAPVGHPLDELPREFQTRFLEAAIAKGKELWSGGWGIAYNHENVRTQCHGHIHIGKLLKGLAPGKFYDAGSVDQIRIPRKGGIWIHPVGNRLRVHYGEQITETVLLR
jgi:hypothetical protein